MNFRQAAIFASSLDDDLRSSLQLARGMSYQGVVVDCITRQLDLTQLSISGQREVTHLLRSNDLQLVAIRVALDPRGFGPSADIDRQLLRIERAMTASAGLGANLVLVDLRALPLPPDPPRTKPKITPEQAGLILIPSLEPEPAPAAAVKVDVQAWSLVQSAMEEAGRRADRFGVRVAFSSGLSSFAALTHAVNSARCAWFGVDLNPVDALRDEWSMDETLSKVATQLFHVQVKDALCGADHRTQPAAIGAGDVNWPELLQKLEQGNYTGWLSVDPTEQTDRLAAARVARNLL